MYKGKLQELCQKRSWDLPEYSTGKNGPQHMLRFTATVSVHGQVFQTPAECRSSREAQNTAAKIAFDHFNGPAPAATYDLPPAPAAVNSLLHGVCPDVAPPVAAPVDPPPELQPIDIVSPILPLSPLPASLPNPPPDKLHIYKNQLQKYAQKQNLGLPAYTTEAEGPPHARRYKSRVSVGGKSYQTAEFFPALKEAEQAAAKVACQALSMDIIQEDGGSYKNLLQEFAQKKGFLCPSYETVTSGMSHSPTFVSTVAIGTETFQGAEAKTKKLAETNAAKVAYCALTSGNAATKSSEVTSTNECHVADDLSQNIQPTTVKKHHDTTSEEANLHTKRAKSSPEIHLEHPSQQVEISTSSESEAEQSVENQPCLKWKTVVFPRKSHLPIPERASVMPYSDNEWVAYKVGFGDQSTT